MLQQAEERDPLEALMGDVTCLCLVSLHVLSRFLLAVVPYTCLATFQAMVSAADMGLWNFYSNHLVLSTKRAKVAGPGPWMYLYREADSWTMAVSILNLM